MGRRSGRPRTRSTACQTNIIFPSRALQTRWGQHTNGQGALNVRNTLRQCRLVTRAADTLQRKTLVCQTLCFLRPCLSLAKAGLHLSTITTLKHHEQDSFQCNEQQVAPEMNTEQLNAAPARGTAAAFAFSEPGSCCMRICSFRRNTAATTPNTRGHGRQVETTLNKSTPIFMGTPFSIIVMPVDSDSFK